MQKMGGGCLVHGGRAKIAHDAVRSKHSASEVSRIPMRALT
jgi:hypothetical protein